MTSSQRRPLSIYTAHGIDDLFNALPTLFGFRPENSLIAIATSGPRRRFGFRLRMDMPAVADVEEAAERVVEYLHTHRAEGAVVLALTSHQGIARDLNAAIEGSLGEIEPVIIARSDGASYWVDVPGFPVEGVPYETSDHHVSVVQAIAAGQEILPNRGALEQRFAAVTGARRNDMQRACEDVLSGLVWGANESLGSDFPAMGAVEPVVDLIERGIPLDDNQVALLCVTFASAEVLDAVWERIRPDTVQVWLRALIHACQLVVPPYESAVLALTSFAAWGSGDGTQALIAAERALGSDPEHPLAAVMMSIVHAGLSPEIWRDQRIPPMAG